MHAHSWRVEGDDNYESFINQCEDCGEVMDDELELEDEMWLREFDEWFPPRPDEELVPKSLWTRFKEFFGL